MDNNVLCQRRLRSDFGCRMAVGVRAISRRRQTDFVALPDDAPNVRPVHDHTFYLSGDWGEGPYAPAGLRFIGRPILTATAKMIPRVQSEHARSQSGT